MRETDISTGRNSHVFCAIDISVQTGQLLAGGERAWEKKEAEENGSAQKITGETVNVTGIIEIFMQVIEVYKLHSFSAQVYSFRQGRRIARENKGNICTFLSRITVICIFLFSVAFVIIIVYKGACADPLHEDVFY